MFGEARRAVSVRTLGEEVRVEPQVKEKDGHRHSSHIRHHGQRSGLHTGGKGGHQRRQG